MNLQDIGKLIAKSRRDAGLTQADLAQKLFVSDKAVSKWERGICQPDSSLLTKLSMLLDVDIDYLVSGATPYGENKWHGEIQINDLVGEVAGKPILHYLLSYFMLVGITDISILTSDRDYVREMHLEQYGLNISFSPLNSEKTMIIYDKFLLFGVNLTRQFQHCMSEDKGMSLTLHGMNVPIVFSHWNSRNSIEYNLKISDKKPLGRGTVFIPLANNADINAASEFVRIYEKYNNKKIADLAEIAKLRGLV